MATAQTSFDRAENACLVFLGGVLGVPFGDGKDLVRDDWLEPDLVNKYAFSISGGPEQLQNLCIAGPGPAWFAYGQLLGQFEKRSDAILVLGKVQNKFPARIAGGCGGIRPNITNFEILEHPEIYSQLILDENNIVSNRIFILRVRFRVVYNNTTD
jgi:hypothetical protein